EDETLLLETTFSRTVHLFPVAPDRTESELKAGGGQGANIQPIVKVAAPVQPRRQTKRKSVVVDAGGASHPPKKLREDHGTPGGTFVGGKSRSAIKRLLAGAVLNAEVSVAAIPTLPFVTASVSSMPEHEAGDHTDSVAEPNLFTIGASQRFFAPVMTTVTTVTSTVDPALMVDEFAPPKFFASIRGMEHDQLFTEFNIRAARQISLSAEVRMRAEFNVKERRRLKSVVEE
ncbi:hypothetical protein Tco_1131660, partial [Tanacetum coccineum]